MTILTFLTFITQLLKKIMETEIKIDGKGNKYVEVGNLRISIIRSENRPSDKDWPGQDVLRIQAYRGEAKYLHMGSELPISKKDNLIDLISAIIHIYKEF